MRQRDYQHIGRLCEVYDFALVLVSQNLFLGPELTFDCFGLEQVSASDGRKCCTYQGFKGKSPPGNEDRTYQDLLMHRETVPCWTVVRVVGQGVA